jgi:cytochrome c-type biogenesis protein CcmH
MPYLNQWAFAIRPYLATALLTALPLVVSAMDTRQLSSPERQADYESLTAELRCLVCQNQTIGDSNAELASDLRRQVAEMLEQGKSRQDIVNFMTERYGDFVLYKPPFKAKTTLLWLGPGVFLLLGLVAVFFILRRRQKTANASLPFDSRKIDQLLDEGEGR